MASDNLCVFKRGLWSSNPLAVHVLGICSALAVTGRLSTSLVMGVAVALVAGASSLVVSLLRRAMPPRVRLITQVMVIATLVIVIDQSLRRLMPDTSRMLGPYVGLIVTNCIVMGRTEAFALRQRPLRSMLDGLGHGAGYGLALAAIGAVRELLGSGKLLGVTLLDKELYTPNLLMVGAPGAFLTLAAAVAIFNAIRLRRARAVAEVAR